MITVLSLFSNRPDFIKPQYDSIKKHVKDEVGYFVINNAYYKQDKPQEIKKIADEEKTGYMRVIHTGVKTDPCILVKDTLNLLWKTFKGTKGILAIIDGDLFFTDKIDFKKLLRGHDMAFCPQYTVGKVWPWTGFMLFDMDKIKVDDMSFSFYALDHKTYSDVGSGVYSYVEKHNPKIKFLDRKELLNGDWPIKDGTLHTLGFPFPYNVDIIRTNERPFAFHYKTSSNYAPHCTPEYNEQKTLALNKLLS